VRTHYPESLGDEITIMEQESRPAATIDIPVRFAECDSYGVVWHGHYALYLEEVRDRLTARFGFTPAKALALGYRVPVTRLEIRYRAPARPDETIRATAEMPLARSAAQRRERAPLAGGDEGADDARVGEDTDAIVAGPATTRSAASA